MRTHRIRIRALAFDSQGQRRGYAAKAVPARGSATAERAAHADGAAYCKCTCTLTGGLLGSRANRPPSCSVEILEPSDGEKVFADSNKVARCRGCIAYRIFALQDRARASRCHVGLRAMAMVSFRGVRAVARA